MRLMDNIIQLNNISFEYESDDKQYSVFEDFSLSFERGSFNVILGHNGSGKSTLAKLLNGLIKPTSGTVLVNGKSTSDSSLDFEIKKTVGLVFQNPDNQIVSSIVEEDVAFGPENLGLNPDIIRKRVDSALKDVDMYEFKDKPTHKLSGGQKQRVAIAGIIAMEPECIVLDEPTAMLDPQGRKEVMNTISRINRELGITVILITHFMEEAEKADRVLVLNKGNVVSDGKPSQVFSDVEVLKAAGLDVPQTTDLLSKLDLMGYRVDKSSVSIDDCVKEISKILNCN